MLVRTLSRLAIAIAVTVGACGADEAAQPANSSQALSEISAPLTGASAASLQAQQPGDTLPANEPDEAAGKVNMSVTPDEKPIPHDPWTHCCGCPDDTKCDRYCRKHGFRGGYCEGFLDLRCKCYG